MEKAELKSFGKPDDGLGFGPEMCNHDHGSTAISATLYYAAEQFPLKYRGRLFIAFHGSWNRAHEPQDGYRVMFVPIARGVATGPSEVFADGFAGKEKTPNGARYRPTGVAGLSPSISTAPAAGPSITSTWRSAQMPPASR